MTGDEYLLTMRERQEEKTQNAKWTTDNRHKKRKRETPRSRNKTRQEQWRVRKYVMECLLNGFRKKRTWNLKKEKR